MNKLTTHPQLLAIIASLAIAAVSTPSASAATVTKADNADDLNLTTSWTGGIVPGAGDVARWDSTVTGVNTVGLGGDLSLAGLSIANPGGAVAISAGNTLTLGTGGIDMSGASQNLTLSSGLTLAPGNQTWVINTGRTLTQNTGAFTRGTASTLLIDRNTLTGTVTTSPSLVNGILGPWAMVKSSGTAANLSANGFTYATTSGGNVVAYTGATSTTWGGTIGTTTVNYDQTATGNSVARGVPLTANTIRNVASTSSTLVFSSGSLTCNGLMTAGAGSVTIGGAVNQGSLYIGGTAELVLTAVNAPIIVNSVIRQNTAGSRVTIVGPSTVTFAGTNAFTGPVYVANGSSLAFGSQTFSSAVSGLGAINNNIGGTVVFTGDHSGFSGTFSQNGANNTQFNSASSGSENAAYNLALGELIFAANGDYTVKMGSLASTAGNIRGGNSATGTTTLEVGNLNTSTSIASNLNNGTTKVMALTKVGTGTLTLNGNNNYSGLTAINNGTLALGASGAISNSTSITVASGATFDVSAVSGGYTLPSGRTLSGSGTVAGSMVAAATSHIIPGTSAGTLTFSGNLTLSGATNTFELSTSVGSGNDKIVVGGNLSLGAADTIRISALSAPSDLDAADYVLFQVTGTITMATTPALVWVGTPPGNVANYILAKVGENVVLKYITATPPTVDASVSPASATRNQAVTVTANVTPGSGNIASVTADLTQIGGPLTAGLVLSNNFVYTNTFVVAASTAVGVKSIGMTVADNTSPTPLTASDVASLTVNAASKVWDGGSSTDDNWASNENWTGDTGPGLAGDSVTFAGSTRLTPNLNASYSVTGVSFDSVASSFTIGSSTGSTLTNGTGGIVNSSASNQTFNVAIVLNGSQTLDAGSGGLALNRTVTGTGTLTKIGTAQLTLSSNVVAGEVNLENGTNFLTGTLESVGGGGRIRVGRNGGNGTLNIQSGATAIANNSLIPGSDTATGTINVNGGTLVHQASLNIYLGSGSGGSTGYLNLNSGTISNLAGGVIIGEGGTSVGAYSQSGGMGILGSDIIVGQTVADNRFNISGGTATAANLYVGSGNGTGTVSLSGGTFSLSGLVRVPNGSSTSSTGTGTVIVSNTAVLNVENDLVLGYQGNANLGKLVVEGGTVNVASTVTRWLIVGQNGTSKGQLDMNSGQLNLNAGTPIRFSTGGTGTLSTNVVNLNGGNITVFSDNGVTVGGGYVDLAQSGGATALNTFNLNGGTLTTTRVGASSTTPTRLFNFNGGTLKAATNSTNFLQGLTAANVLANGAVIDTTNFNITIAQPLLEGGGGGGLTKIGNGTLILNGISTYTGTTTVSAGMLGGNGTIAGPLLVASGATLAPGTSIGAFTVNGAATLNGTIIAEITNGPSADFINFGGGATLGGTLTVLANGTLASGQTFNLFDGALSGTFSSLSLPNGASHWNTSALYTSGEITYANANPVASNFDLGVAAGGSAAVTVIGKHVAPVDADGDAVTVTTVSAPANGTVAIVGGTNIVYTSTNSMASDSFTYTVSDGIGGIDTKTITVSTYSPEGFNRLSPPSVIGPGTVVLSYLGIPGYNYALDWTTNLTPPITWTAIITNTAAGNGGLSYTNSSSEPVNFFRTRHVP